ncbi:hypothetical protein L596_020313 [Steinernema carpocapsae]|uniref:Uncharacterized protein n=1 Tax=Steinernema carpocapsae TaxID=34508 RepID=A0A4U5MT81_STECR|nr:hypothetical protein L596_020313 [Steinernema carpocapsae]
MPSCRLAQRSYAGCHARRLLRSPPRIVLRRRSASVRQIRPGKGDYAEQEPSDGEHHGDARRRGLRGGGRAARPERVGQGRGAQGASAARRETHGRAGPPDPLSAPSALDRLLQPRRVSLRGLDAEPLRDDARARAADERQRVRQEREGRAARAAQLRRLLQQGLQRAPLGRSPQLDDPHRGGFGHSGQEGRGAGAREVRRREHRRTRQGQMALPALRQEVPRSGVHQEALIVQVRRADGSREGRRRILQQLHRRSQTTRRGRCEDARRNPRRRPTRARARRARWRPPRLRPKPLLRI